MKGLVKLSLAVALAVTALPFARALPGFDSNAVKPAAGYGIVTPNPSNPLQVTVTATKPGYGIFWVVVSSPDCALQTQSISPSLPWSTHPDRSAAVWRTNTSPNGKMLVPSGTAGYMSNPSTAVFTAKTRGNCTVDTVDVYLHVIDLSTGNTFWAKPGGCSGILIFGRDPFLTTAVQDALVAKGIDPGSITFVNTGLNYTPGALTMALAGKTYCTMVFDPEYIGQDGTFSGLDTQDQTTLQNAILGGMGLVYLEPKPVSGYPNGQMAGILPLDLCSTFLANKQYTITNPSSPLATGVPTTFNAASQGEDGFIGLIDVPGVTYANVTTVATAAPDQYCATGGPTVLTLDYQPSSPSMLPGGRVAILGTDPYPDNGVDFTNGPDVPALMQLIYNAVLYTGHYIP